MRCRLLHLLPICLGTWSGGAEIVASSPTISSDGMWKVAVEDTARLIVGEPGTVKISIASSAAGATECPKITNVVLEMPQHGHGSDYATSFLPTGSCRWKIEGITATMRGSWRLRLILEWGNTVAVADMSLAAQ